MTGEVSWDSCVLYIINPDAHRGYSSPHQAVASAPARSKHEATINCRQCGVAVLIAIDQLGLKIESQTNYQLSFLCVRNIHYVTILATMC